MAQPATSTGRKTKEIHQDYEGFVEKFKPKLTTDDCITPKPVYEAIAEYVAEKYGVARDRMVRPFWPGADYKAFAYAPESVVVDNPPFSILASIIQWYLAQKIPFFLFAPKLTVMGSARFDGVTAVFAHAEIVYENGAKVPTAFVTSLDPEYVAFSDVAFGEKINEAAKLAESERKPKKTVPKYTYPAEVVTGALLDTWAGHGVTLAIKREDAVFIRELDSQKTDGKSIFGGGLLLSERAAAERAAAERAAAERAAAERAAAERAAAERAAALAWRLSDREHELCRSLGRPAFDKPQEGGTP